MITNILWLLELVRDEILEAFILPELDISYWDFCIYLAIAGVVITVLINAVQVSGSIHNSSAKESKYHEILRKRERVKADERVKIKNNKTISGSSINFDAYEKIINRD